MAAAGFQVGHPLLGGTVQRSLAVGGAAGKRGGAADAAEKKAKVASEVRGLLVVVRGLVVETSFPARVHSCDGGLGFLLS
jgi:hypothetical protein